MEEEKKIRVIKEIEPELKQVEKEEQEEESLEEQVEPETAGRELEEEEFPDFAERVSPVLESTTTTADTENIEETLENVPTPEIEEEQVEYEIVYNMPQYNYEKRASPMQEEMERTGIMVRPTIRPEDVREIRPEARIEQWHEIREAEERVRRQEDAVIDAKRLDREGERRLPHEQTSEETRKYRGRRI